MPTTFVESISTVTSPDAEMEQDFELDIRVTNSTPTNIEEGPISGSCPSICHDNSCHQSCYSVWYAWCCN